MSDNSFSETSEQAIDLKDCEYIKKKKKKLKNEKDELYI